MKTPLTNEQKAAIERMEAHIKGELTAVDVEQRFRDMLDECYDFKAVGGPFSHMLASRVLEEMDPTAFRCGISDMSPDDTTYEIDGEIYDQREVDEKAEEFIDELRSELADAEAEIEDDEEADRSEVERLTAEIEACERHSW